MDMKTKKISRCVFLLCIPLFCLNACSFAQSGSVRNSTYAANAPVFVSKKHNLGPATAEMTPVTRFVFADDLSVTNTGSYVDTKKEGTGKVVDTGGQMYGAQIMYNEGLLPDPSKGEYFALDDCTYGYWLVVAYYTSSDFKCSAQYFRKGN